MVKILSGKEYELLINKYKNIDSYINRNQMNELIDKILAFLPSTSYYNSIKESKIFYFNKNINHIDLYNINQNKYQNKEDIILL